MKNNKSFLSGQKEEFVERLRLPKDVCLGALKVTVLGNGEAWIENYRGILEYTNQKIVLQTRECKVVLEGKNLTICYYTNDNMKIRGCIYRVLYLV